MAALVAVLALRAFPAQPSRGTVEPLQLTPGELAWRPSPTLPAGARVSVLYGDPEKDGPFVLRTRFPPNSRVPPHSTWDDSTLTVLSGTLYRGTGDRCDEATLKALPAGSFVLDASDENVLLVTRDEEVVVEVHGHGPLGPVVHPNPADEARGEVSATAAHPPPSTRGPGPPFAPRDLGPVEARTADRDARR